MHVCICVLSHWRYPGMVSMSAICKAARMRTELPNRCAREAAPGPCVLTLAVPALTLDSRACCQGTTTHELHFWIMLIILCLTKCDLVAGAASNLAPVLNA